MTLGAKFMAALSGAVDGWRNAGLVPRELSEIQREYQNSWYLYTGKLFHDLKTRGDGRDDPRVYTETRLLWKHAEAMVDFYAGVVYAGALPTDGKPLPDGVKSAIPIEPQTGTDERNALLLQATSALWSGWNWQQKMSLRPMYAAALGDVLTELTDNLDRRFVYPTHVWPGYVTDLELDDVDNVRAYTLEYPVDDKQPDGTLDRYLYRKEVTGKEFRHYRDDRLIRADPNPYGFVPAVWDRHRTGDPGSVRGRSAFAGTKQALWEINSMLSHAMDYQRTAFTLPPMIATDRPASSNVEIEVNADRESRDYIPVPGDATLLQTQVDIGKTLEMVKDLREQVLAENPEAAFFQKMRDMQIVSAPGANQLMGDVQIRVDMVNSGHDAQTIKLVQMAIAMCGMRVRNGDWTRNGGRLDDRRAVFANFDLGSYGRGDLNMTIESPRKIVVPTDAELVDMRRAKAEMLATVEALSTDWALEEMDIEKPATRAAILDARRERYTVGLNSGAFGKDYEEEAS